MQCNILKVVGRGGTAVASCGQQFHASALRSSCASLCWNELNESERGGRLLLYMYICTCIYDMCCSTFDGQYLLTLGG